MTRPIARWLFIATSCRYGSAWFATTPSRLRTASSCGATLHNLADLLRQLGRLDEALALERQAIPTLRGVYRENVLDRDHRQALSYACWTLCALALDHKDHRAAAQAVADYLAIEPNGYEEAIESARFLCRCAELSAADVTLAEPERERLVRSYSDQAMRRSSRRSPAVSTMLPT